MPKQQSTNARAVRRAQKSPITKPAHLKQPRSRIPTPPSTLNDGPRLPSQYRQPHSAQSPVPLDHSSASPVPRGTPPDPLPELLAIIKDEGGPPYMDFAYFSEPGKLRLLESDPFVEKFNEHNTWCATCHKKVKSPRNFNITGWNQHRTKCVRDEDLTEIEDKRFAFFRKTGSKTRAERTEEKIGTALEWPPNTSPAKYTGSKLSYYLPKLFEDPADGEPVRPVELPQESAPPPPQYVPRCIVKNFGSALTQGDVAINSPFRLRALNPPAIDRVFDSPSPTGTIPTEPTTPEIPGPTTFLHRTPTQPVDPTATIHDTPIDPEPHHEPNPRASPIRWETSTSEIPSVPEEEDVDSPIEGAGGPQRNKPGSNHAQGHPYQPPTRKSSQTSTKTGLTRKHSSGYTLGST